MIRVLVVEELRLLRETLGQVLNERVDIAVVGAAGSPARALAMVQDLDPHVVLVGMRMPESQALIRDILSTCSNANVVALGDCDTKAHGTDSAGR
jgi:chemotaxis response regulator CheB